MFICCTRCKEEKCEDEFHKSSYTKTGRQSRCKLCRNLSRDADKVAQYRKKYYDQNKDKLLEEQRKFRQDNKEFTKAKERKKYEANREKILRRVSQYQKNYPEVSRSAGKKYRQRTPQKQAAKAAKRRFRVQNAAVSWINTEWEQFAIAEIYSISHLRSQMTKVKHHVDHIIPLKSDLVCGLHCSSNLQVIEWIHNIKKHNNFNIT